LEKIKVAYLTHTLSFGGATISLLLLQKSINHELAIEKYLYTANNKDKNLCELMLKYNKSIQKVDLKRIDNHQLYTTSFTKFLFSKKYWLKEFHALLIKDKIDILHINTTVYPHVVKYIKENSKIRIVTHVREMIPKYGLGFLQNYLIKNIKNYSDSIIAISDNEGEHFINSNKLQIIPNPFDFDSSEYIEKLNNKKVNDPNGTVKIGMLGNLSKIKGPMVFIKSLNYIIKTKKVNAPIKFYILGGNYKKQSLLKVLIKKILNRDTTAYDVLSYIEKNDLYNYIELKPYSIDAITFISEMDIIARPALTGDPWGRDIIEAFSLMKPIIATGTSEFYVENNHNGFLVKPNDHIELGDKISDLVLNKEKREEFGKRGYQKVRNMCDLEKYGKNITKTYHNLISVNNETI